MITKSTSRVCLSAIVLCLSLNPANGDIPNGDFDGNGRLEAADIDALTHQVLTGHYDAAYDLNDDLVLNSEDRRVWIHELAFTFYGDSDLNGVFNTGDLIHVFKYGQYDDQLVANSGWQQGDWNGDLELNSADLVIAFQDGGFEGRPRLRSNRTSAVPEPTFWGWGGVLCLWALRRHRENRASEIAKRAQKANK